MSRKKTKKQTSPTALDVLAAARAGAPVNVRPGGPMLDKRLRRRRTRRAAETAEIAENEPG